MVDFKGAPSTFTVDQFLLFFLSPKSKNRHVKAFICPVDVYLLLKYQVSFMTKPSRHI